MNVLGYTQDKSMLNQDKLFEEPALKAWKAHKGGSSSRSRSRLGQRSDSGLSQRSSSRMLGQWSDSRLKTIRCEPEELEEFEDEKPDRIEDELVNKSC